MNKCIEGKNRVMEFRKANIKDIKQIHALVNFYAQKREMLPRALSELYENVREFYVVIQGDKVIACGALHISWEDLAEVKSMAVAPEFVRKGLGKKLLTKLLIEAKQLGVQKVFALTYKPKFFVKLGFRRIKKDLLPHKVWTECINCEFFPNCGEVAVMKVLKKNLSYR